MEENKDLYTSNDPTRQEPVKDEILAIKKKRIKQTRRMIASSIALIITTVIIFSMQTVAYFTDGADAEMNILKTGFLDVKIVESTLADESNVTMSYPQTPINIMPSSRVSKIVTVYNMGNIDAWIRVKIDKTVTSMDSGEALNVDTELFICDYNTDDWTYADGYWYYNAPLEAGEITTPLFRTVTFAAEMDNRYASSTVTFAITSEAVQKNSNGASALEAFWSEGADETN